MSRGFGKVKVKIKKGDFNVINDIKERLEDLYLSDSLDEINLKLRDFIQLCFKITSQYLYRNSSIYPSKSPVSAIVPSSQIFKIEAVRIFDNVTAALKCIGKATMKINWKKYRKDTGKRYHTWILGLPRYGKRVKETTGYLVRVRHEVRMDIRRPSSIGFSILKLNNNLFCVVMYGFLVTDFIDLLKGSPKGRLVHRSIYTTHSRMRKIRRKITQIKETKVLDDAYNLGIHPRIHYSQARNEFQVLMEVFDVAWNTTKNIIRRCQLSVP